MNWLDIAIIVVVLTAAIFGLKNGLIRSLATVVGIAIGTWVARQYYEPVAENLLPILNNVTASKIASFILLFLAILVLSSLIGLLLKKIVSFVFLGWLDALIGGALGFVVGIALVGIVLSLLGSADALGISGPIKDSNLAPLITARMPLILDLLPKQFDIRELLFP